MDKAQAIEVARECMQKVIDTLNMELTWTPAGTQQYEIIDDRVVYIADIRKELKVRVKKLKVARAVLKEMLRHVG